MSTYRVLDGHDNSIGDLVAISPQPEGMPVAPVVRNYGLTSVPHDHGKVAIWRWNALQNEAMYLAVLTALGLHNADFNDVTIYTRSERMLWTMYNARAIFPLMAEDARWSNFYPRDITVTFTRLEVLI